MKRTQYLQYVQNNFQHMWVRIYFYLYFVSSFLFFFRFVPSIWTEIFFLLITNKFSANRKSVIHTTITCNFRFIPHRLTSTEIANNFFLFAIFVCSTIFFRSFFSISTRIFISSAENVSLNIAANQEISYIMLWIPWTISIQNHLCRFVYFYVDFFR